MSIFQYNDKRRGIVADSSWGISVGINRGPPSKDDAAGSRPVHQLENLPLVQSSLAAFGERYRPVEKRR